MIKYKVTINTTELEFADESSANEYVSNNGGTVSQIDEFTDITNDEKKIIQSQLLAAAWDFITPYYDQPAFIQMTDWKSNIPNEHAVHPLIASIQKWKDAVMIEYIMRKKPYMWHGYPYDFDFSFIGPPPCSFTDIFLTVNTQLMPPGYVIPDVTGYTPGTR